MPDRCSLGTPFGYQTSEGLVIDVRLSPKSSADQIVGIADGAHCEPVLKVRVKAAPEKGKANGALAALIADWLDVPKSACKVVTGGKSRKKQVLISGEPDALMSKLRHRLSKFASGD